MMIRCMTAFVLATALITPTMAQSTATSNMEILREKIKGDKKLVVAANLDLTDAEGAKFWPVYESYQKDLAQNNQRMAATIKTYAEAYNKGTVPDETAKKLIDEAIAIDEAEVKQKRALATKVMGVLPATKAARYIQIENKIRAAIRYELAGGIPLVE